MKMSLLFWVKKVRGLRRDLEPPVGALYSEFGRLGSQDLQGGGGGGGGEGGQFIYNRARC